MKLAAVIIATVYLSSAEPSYLSYAQPPGMGGPIPPYVAPSAPAGNPITTAKANLGKALFWDEQLSSTRTVACGTCHRPSGGGGDPRAIVGSSSATNPGVDLTYGNGDDITASPGVPRNLLNGKLDWSTVFGLREQVTTRTARSYIDAGYSTTLFWDGRAGETFRDPITNAVVLQSGAALESQALGPPVGDSEMAHVGRDWSDVASRVSVSRPLALATSIPAALEQWINKRTYPQLFSEAFGSQQVTPSRIAMAIATYERTLYSGQTPLDMAGAQLTAQEANGRNIFFSRRCDACHRPPLFSDNLFHYIGVRPQAEDLGRFNVTNNPADRGAMRTPNLRNVQLRKSFMRNGRFSTLEQVIEFYNRGGDFTAPNKSPQIVPLNLSAQQKADLAAFLRRPLTDPRVQAQTSPFDIPSLYGGSSRVPQTFGVGTAGSGGRVPQAVAIEPPLLGNPTFAVGIYGALGGAQAILVIDKTDPGPDADIPSTASIARAQITLSGSGAENGYGSAVVAIPNDARLIGETVYGRWFVMDATAPGGVAASAAFRMTIFGIGEVSAAEPVWALYN